MKNNQTKQIEPLTTGQIAEYCHVTVRAVLKWVAEGKLKAYRTPGHHSRVKVEDFIKFLNDYNMPVPEALKSGNGKKKVLIVDDDKEMVNSIRRVLVLDNIFAIEVAFDGFEAGQKFADFQPDLLILDIKMPGMDGYEVIRRIRSDEDNKGVKIIVVSGVVDMLGSENVLKMGANDYLAKPFDNNELKKKINKLLGIKAADKDRDGQNNG